DRDGRPDVMVCDARLGQVIWYKQTSKGKFETILLNKGNELAAPCGATVVDLDQDGDPDVLVSVLGSVFPSDDRIGKVVWLENRGFKEFIPHTLLADVHRISDVQAGDFDRDGDLDLVVAAFGYDHGNLMWLENMGKMEFREHALMATPGTIHVPVADFDRDGDLDIIALVSQDEEEVWAFENLGGKKFAPKRRLLYRSYNFDLGTAGLFACDLDKDGDQDLLLVAGDNLEILHHYPQPWHGCIWLENLGNWKFVPQRIASVGGPYAAGVGDLDGDGDNDVVLVSMFNDWKRPNSASIIWLENDGKQKFKPWQIADHPTNLATVACGDLNGDGRADIVAGSMHLLPPFQNMNHVVTFMSRKEGP
ncbi:MAG: FG-GAP repeat domain-containing protein, partial [Bdellovibrionales bacterium]